LLVPSLWNESFGLVAAEAMINGIPVLVSDRGALPEVMGTESRIEDGGWRIASDRGGFLFDIPEEYTPETTSVPTAEEVEPWVQTIIRLWDDHPLYQGPAGRIKGVRNLFSDLDQLSDP
jgi:glycosyltransferase involved in cell wall biosynthesis